ncbi:HNH endonuclease [Mycobacterium intracellulare]|uniref:HNH endonuclease n=1 Tax=Mycobacterium intracellulare TaxID=1767 RepID=UPI001916B98B
MQPFCPCGATSQLEADHIIPVAVAPELAYEILNLTTRCRTCNARRGTNYTEAEGQAVRAAIAARKQRVANVTGIAIAGPERHVDGRRPPPSSHYMGETAQSH